MNMKEIHKRMSEITEDQNKNHINYMSSLKYISNLYVFLNTLGSVVDMSRVRIVSKYKDFVLTDSLGIESCPEENQFRYFVIESPMFSDDLLVERIKEMFEDNYERFERKEATKNKPESLVIILKEN